MDKNIKHQRTSFFHAMPVLIILTVLIAACNLPVFGQEPPCGTSTLQIGESTYQIKEIKTRSDGSIKVPSNTSDNAYWVNQTNTNIVFALSPTTENLALHGSSPSKAVVAWANCNSSTYTLSAPQNGIPGMDALLDQSFSGITVFVQGDGGGFVIRGELMGEEIQVFDTPDPLSMQAEIALQETVPSADKTTITVIVSITNYGQSITLTSESVSLLVHDSISMPLDSEPPLPKEIASGATETLSFTFAYPIEPGATLKVFDVEYELEGY